MDLPNQAPPVRREAYTWQARPAAAGLAARAGVTAAQICCCGNPCPCCLNCPTGYCGCDGQNKCTCIQ
jgi:hypothetical protein